MKMTVTKKTAPVKSARTAEAMSIRLDLPPPLAARLLRVSAYEMKTPEKILFISLKSFLEMAEGEMKHAVGL